MQSSIPTDQELLSALAAGDRKATSEIYRKNYPIVKGWIIKNGGTEADCADIFQESMVVVFGKVQEVDFKLTCSIGTYIFAVCKNFWYKKLQKQSNEPGINVENTLVLENMVPGVEDDLKVHHEREMHFRQLDSALDQIGEPCRSILKAYYHEEKNMQDIAYTFGYTNAENAKNQKYKCLARLKKLFFSAQEK